ncbi:hypothetical protein V8C86DRAFT_1294206 [Haematococcus lacustris]
MSVRLAACSFCVVVHASKSDGRCTCTAKGTKLGHRMDIGREWYRLFVSLSSVDACQTSTLWLLLHLACFLRRHFDRRVLFWDECGCAPGKASIY